MRNRCVSTNTAVSSPPTDAPNGPTDPGHRATCCSLSRTFLMVVRARRCEVTEGAVGIGRSDYASAFEATIAESDGRSAEQWARNVFEDAPTAIGYFVVFGWRFALGLRLGPRSSSDYVSGWRVRDTRPGVILLEVDSWLLTALKEVRVASGSVRVSTFVRYKRGLGRAIWTLVSPIHHRTEPYLLGYATSRRH
jgi:hypothetical protein